MTEAPRPVPFLTAVVALAGAGTMTVELSAVRLLAPWFGASSGVWTNVIGVILLALALGYLIGARLSRRPQPERALGLALLASAVATVWLPFGARPVAEAFMPAGLALDEAASLLVWGSLAASLVLFLPAAALLGCVGPLAVETIATTRDVHPGDAGGRVLAASTGGSLLGTFGTTHLFLPVLGIDWTFLVASAVLAGSGAWVLFHVRGTPRAAAAVALGFCALGLAFSRSASPGVREGWTLLAERQSPYQSIRVVDLPADYGELRYLQVNESFDSYQSVWQPDAGLLPPGYYYNYFAPPVWWERAEASASGPSSIGPSSSGPSSSGPSSSGPSSSGPSSSGPSSSGPSSSGPSASEGSWRTLVLGLGAGTTVRVMEGAMPDGVELLTVGVEIDPAVVELAREHFELELEPPARTVLAGLDARGALQATGGGFDQVVLDCYANNMEVPAHLSTIEFFREVHDVLRDGGWLTVNAAGFGLDDPVVDALGYTLSRAFGTRALAVRVPFSRNWMLYVRRAGEVPTPGGDGWAVESGEIGALLGAVELEGSWRWNSTAQVEGSVLLTDDRNPIDRLQLESIAAGRRRWFE